MKALLSLLVLILAGWIGYLVFTPQPTSNPAVELRSTAWVEVLLRDLNAVFHHGLIRAESTYGNLIQSVSTQCSASEAVQQSPELRAALDAYFRELAKTQKQLEFFEARITRTQQDKPALTDTTPVHVWRDQRVRQIMQQRDETLRTVAASLNAAAHRLIQKLPPDLQVGARDQLVSLRDEVDERLARYPQSLP